MEIDNIDVVQSPLYDYEKGFIWKISNIFKSITNLLEQQLFSVITNSKKFAIVCREIFEYV